MIENKKAFWLSFLCVGFGSLVLFTMMFPTDYLYNEDLSPILMLLTLPFTFLSFGFLYTETNWHI